jgi:hypothetical protein
MKFPAPALNASFVGKLPQHALEHDAVDVLQAERACDLAGANFSRPLAYERDKIVFGRKLGFRSRGSHALALRARVFAGLVAGCGSAAGFALALRALLRGLAATLAAPLLLLARAALACNSVTA